MIGYDYWIKKFFHIFFREAELEDGFKSILKQAKDEDFIVTNTNSYVSVTLLAEVEISEDGVIVDLIKKNSLDTVRNLYDSTSSLKDTIFNHFGISGDNSGKDIPTIESSKKEED